MSLGVGKVYGSIWIDSGFCIGSFSNSPWYTHELLFKEESSTIEAGALRNLIREESTGLGSPKN